MRFFEKADDGGPDSGVKAYFLVEIKGLFSIALLRFSPGSREAFHEHAFHALSWMLKGRALEVTLDEGYDDRIRYLRPSPFPKLTKRQDCHKVIAGEDGAWMFTVRGPWTDTWREYRRETDSWVTMTHGRKIIRDNA